jgi:hypothetical protein
MPNRDNSPHELLARTVAEHLASWKTPHVELDIHGTGDADEIAAAIDGACSRYLGAPVARPIFYQSSIGAVAGLELDDGRRVALKAHQSTRPEALLREVVRVQSVVSRQVGLAPAVLAGPFAFGNGLAVFEEYVDAGIWADPHEASTRRELARSLHSILAALLPIAADCTLPGHLLPSPVDGPLWPTPHSKLFDFNATQAGAEDIDDVARAAHARTRPVGRIAVAHGDWRAEHVRFQNGVAVAAYDWDSLCKLSEPALIGFTAHAFCADWSRANHVQAPTVAEARAFVRDYEVARGQPFEREESALCSACFAYSVAYTARCGHALGVDQRQLPGTFQHLIAEHGVTLVAALE